MQTGINSSFTSLCETDKRVRSRFSPSNKINDIWWMSLKLLLKLHQKHQRRRRGSGCNPQQFLYCWLVVVGVFSLDESVGDSYRSRKFSIFCCSLPPVASLWLCEYSSWHGWNVGGTKSALAGEWRVAQWKKCTRENENLFTLACSRKKVEKNAQNIFHRVLKHKNPNDGGAEHSFPHRLSSSAKLKNSSLRSRTAQRREVGKYISRGLP